MSAPTPDLILINGKFATLDRANPQADAVALTGEKFTAVGTRDDVMRLAGSSSEFIDLKGRRVIP